MNRTQHLTVNKEPEPEQNSPYQELEPETWIVGSIPFQESLIHIFTVRLLSRAVNYRSIIIIYFALNSAIIKHKQSCSAN